MFSKYFTLRHLGRQVREELWELNDKETVSIVRKSRKGKSEYSIPFLQWSKAQSL